MTPDSYSDRQPPVPDTSMWPGDGGTPPDADRLLQQAVLGAHNTIDRLANRAAPAVHELGDRVAAAEDSLHATTRQLRDTRDAWAEQTRGTVRRHPLAWAAAALVLGLVLGRLAG